jgi:hypothetical protein
MERREKERSGCEDEGATTATNRDTHPGLISVCALNSHAQSLKLYYFYLGNPPSEMGHCARCLHLTSNVE